MREASGSKQASQAESQITYRAAKCGESGTDRGSEERIKRENWQHASRSGRVTEKYVDREGINGADSPAYHVPFVKA